MPSARSVEVKAGSKTSCDDRALPEDPLWRPAHVAPLRLAARYQPQHLLAIEPQALKHCLRNRATALVARRALAGLPEPARSHLEKAIEPRERRPNSGPASWEELAARLAWDLLYWNEPKLYNQLTEGEPLHPGLLGELPLHGGTVLDVGAGTGRLTTVCAAGAAYVYALEPARPLRDLLCSKLKALGITNVEVLPGWSSSIPLADGAVELVVSASAFGADAARGGDDGLRELRRVTRPGGGIYILWPDDPRWFLSRGFYYHAFGGPMAVRFRDLETALACAEIFYPPAVTAHLEQTGQPVVPFELIGVNAPRDLCACVVA